VHITRPGGVAAEVDDQGTSHGLEGGKRGGGRNFVVSQEGLASSSRKQDGHSRLLVGSGVEGLAGVQQHGSTGWHKGGDVQSLQGCRRHLREVPAYRSGFSQ